MKDRILCAVDAGATRVACMAFDGCSDHVQPLAVSVTPSAGFAKGEIIDPEKASESIHAGLEQIEQSLGKAPDAIIVTASSTKFRGVPAQGYIPIFPKGRPISKDDVLQVVNHSRQVALSSDEEQLQAIPRGFKVDDQAGIQNPVGKTGSRLEVVTYLSIANKSAIAERSKTVALAGFKVEQFVLGPMASGLAVLTSDERELGTVCVDIGASKCDISIFIHGGLGWSDTIPVGARNVTLDVASLLKTAEEEAERLKIQFGSAVAGQVNEAASVDVAQIGQSGPRPLAQRVLCEIIESRMREIARLAIARVEKSGLKDQLAGGCVITGGGSQLRGTAALFEKETGWSRVRIGQPSLDFSDFQAGADVPSGSLSALVGAALFAHTDEEDELTTAVGVQGLKERVRTFWSILSSGYS